MRSALTQKGGIDAEYQIARRQGGSPKAGRKSYDPGAVQRVLRVNGFGNRPDFREIMGDICAELQRRATARRAKNKRLGRASVKTPEQLEFKLSVREARRLANERRDHLLADL